MGTSVAMIAQAVLVLEVGTVRSSFFSVELASRAVSSLLTGRAPVPIKLNELLDFRPRQARPACAPRAKSRNKPCKVSAFMSKCANTEIAEAVVSGSPTISNSDLRQMDDSSGDSIQPLSENLCEELPGSSVCHSAEGHYIGPIQRKLKITRKPKNYIRIRRRRWPDWEDSKSNSVAITPDDDPVCPIEVPTSRNIVRSKWRLKLRRRRRQLQLIHSWNRNHAILSGSNSAPTIQQVQNHIDALRDAPEYTIVNGAVPQIR